MRRVSLKVNLDLRALVNMANISSSVLSSHVLRSDTLFISFCHASCQCLASGPDKASSRVSGISKDFGVLKAGLKVFTFSESSIVALMSAVIWLVDG